MRLFRLIFLVALALPATAQAEEATIVSREVPLAGQRLLASTNNALVGDADTIAAQMAERFHAEDRLMLWFDFNNHDSKRVMKNMSDFMTRIAPQFT